MIFDTTIDDKQVTDVRYFDNPSRLWNIGYDLAIFVQQFGLICRESARGACQNGTAPRFDGGGRSYQRSS
jgi:hypothetical protein